MIEARVILSDTHAVVISDGCIAIEADGAPLWEEPLEVGYPKLELALRAARMGIRELDSAV